MPPLREPLEKSVPHALEPGPVHLGLEQCARPPGGRGVALPFVEDDAVPEECVEEWITGVGKAHHVDLHPGSFAEVRRQP